MSSVREYLTGPFQAQRRRTNTSVWTPVEWSLPNKEEMFYSFNHFPLNTRIDDGGPWYATKLTEHVSGTYASNFTNGGYVYTGPFTVGGGASPSITAYDIPSEIDLTLHGTTMVARSLPTNPAMDLAVALGEAREGLPSAVGWRTFKDRTAVARNAGSEYLNIEFGWKPLVSDVKSFAKTVQSSADIWSNYRKGSAKKTRVGYHLEDLEKSNLQEDVLFAPLPASFPSTLRGSYHEAYTTHTWFKGCFRYYIPSPVGLDSKFAYWKSQASKLFGLRLTPEVLWNLSPWTWAADWFSNAGDVLHNVSQLGNDGLVMQYGYAMSEQKRTFTRTASTFHSGLTAKRVTEAKSMRRVAATPYGFGVDLSTLSGRQTAVLVALGLSRT